MWTNLNVSKIQMQQINGDHRELASIESEWPLVDLRSLVGELKSTTNRSLRCQLGIAKL